MGGRDRQQGSDFQTEQAKQLGMPGLGAPGHTGWGWGDRKGFLEGVHLC